nr:hypothetical protein [Tanacetum cinerariifolium]
MSTFVLCVGCGTPLYGFSRCQWCTCERCGNDLRDGFCALCNSRNSCVYDPNPNSFDYPLDSYHSPHPTYETYSGDSCGNDSQFGYDCPPRFSLNYEPELGYIQNYNFYPHDSLSFPQQYLCCDNCGGLHETFQCQSMNQDFYNSNSSSFDQSQTPQFPVIHPPPQETSIKILHDQENEINSVETFLRKLNRYSFFKTPKVLLLAWDKVFKIKDAFGNKQYKPEDIQELFRELFNVVQNIHEELAEYINTPGWNRPAFYNNGDDDDEDCTVAVTPDFPITDSLIIENEHLDTILETKSDEFIKSSVENLVPIPSESRDFFDIKSECDMPDCDDSQTTNFSTFSNPLFDDSTSSDDESNHEEVIHEISFKTYSNPLFDLNEEIISSEFNLIHNEDLDSTLKNNRFDTDSYLLESSLNRDTLMISSLKIDSLLVEFAGELTLLKSIPPGIDKTDCRPENEIRLTKRLLYDNSSPRPPKEFVSENSNANIESFFPSPIPVEDSDSRMEEIDLFLTPDDPMSPSIKDDDDDSERDILILEELPSNYSLSLPEIESFYFNIPSFSRPPAKPPDGNTGILNIKMMGDVSDQKVPIPGLTITRVSNQEKSPDLLSHQGLEIFKLSAKCPMMIHGKNIPILNVPLFYFYPLDQLKYGGNWVKLSDLKQALRGRHPMLIRSLVLVMNNVCLLYAIVVETRFSCLVCFVLILVVQYSRKLEDSCQRILSSKSSFPQLQLGIQYPNLIDLHFIFWHT